MAQKGIPEFQAKRFLAQNWPKYFKTLQYNFKVVSATSAKDLWKQTILQKWLQKDSLVVKPDMLFGKRGKNKLVYLKNQQVGDVTLKNACDWISEKTTKSITLLNGSEGQLNRFIIEPFIPLNQVQGFYVSYQLHQTHDVINVSCQGGVEIEENWDSVIQIKVPFELENAKLEKLIQSNLPQNMHTPQIQELIKGLYLFFQEFHFAYLEFNPFFIQNNQVYLLDTVAKLDDTAKYLFVEEWKNIEFPRAFGQDNQSEEEKFIEELDAKSGSSLKLTILNPEAPVWTLVAGGGASVVYADTIANIWGADQLANYGEYSGNPSTQETYQYTKTVLDLMTRTKAKKGKILLIGGAIANFTDVAKTFKGIIQALEKYAAKLQAIKVNIYVRRGGPNYEIGLKNIKAAGKKLNLPIEVYGPETHMTEIVDIAYEDQKGRR